MTLKNKRILIITSSIIVTGLLGYGLYEVFKPNVVYVDDVSSYTVVVEGAVKNPGSYTFEKPKTIREIIFSASVLTNADISTLDLEKIISNDYQIIVPYKVGAVEKIKWKDLHSVEQLTELGIKKSIAQIIINHRRQNETTTWEEILALKGIGQVTLAQLKDVIDLS